MEVFFEQVDVSHLRVGDFLADRVRSTIKLRLDTKAGGRARRADQLHDGLVIQKRPATPILRDVTEHAVLDLVPLGCAGGKVRHPDREAGSVGKLLKLGPLPSAQPAARHPFRRCT